MSDDLDELLNRTAPAPRRSVDLEAVTARSRHRSRRARGGIAAAVLAVMAAGVVAWPVGSLQRVPGVTVEHTPFAGDSDASSDTTVTTEALAGTVWRLVELPDGRSAPSRYPDIDVPHLLTFDGRGGVTFDTDCNDVDASYLVTEGRLELSDGLTSMAPCPDGTEEVGGIIRSSLFSSPYVSLDRDRLVLRGESGDLTYQRSDSRAPDIAGSFMQGRQGS